MCLSYLIGYANYLKAVVDGEHGKLKAMRLTRLGSAVLLDSSVSEVSQKNSDIISEELSGAAMEGQRDDIAAGYSRKRRD